ncbi:unnamed protein product [Brassicogethes aeneus]|uniref:Uncharacterized protein n=1 Tax=Brassicogethes aeneus TaxID=1431903 RepID=A0A9P0FMQ6_BRAAE|nr:unnamed protein product [Brassicogethes aeneus]
MRLRTLFFHFVIFISSFLNLANGQSLKSSDVGTLSELSLDKLLEVRKSFLLGDLGNKEVNGNLTDEKENLPEPLALQGLGKRKPNDRGGYHTYVYEDDYKKHDKKDVQSIFQISVTTLAFLAFGGYLLCLLCQAISAKNDYNNNNANTQVVQAIIKSQNIRRGTRRPNGVRRPTSYRKKYPNRYGNLRPRPRVKRDVWDMEDTDKMYWALIRLSEGYAGYHTIQRGGENRTYTDYLDF